MLINFEDLTEELNEYELGTLLPVFIAGMSKYIGRENSIKTEVICKRLVEKGYKVTPARIRKLVHFCRVRFIVANLPGDEKIPRLRGIIVGTSNGYYISTDKKEIEDCILSNKQRIRSITEIVNGMEAELFKLIEEGVIKV